MGARTILAIFLSVLLANAPVAPAASPEVVGKLTGKGAVELNGRPTPAETTVFAGDRIRTQREAAVVLALRGGNQIVLPALSAVQLSQNGNRLTALLEQGALAVLSRSDQAVLVQANSVDIVPAANTGTVFEVVIEGQSLKVLARRGSVLVKATNQSVVVKEGMELNAQVGPATQGPAGNGSGYVLATWTLVLLAGAGVAGVVLGAAALRRANPENCVVVSPSRISCP